MTGRNLLGYKLRDADRQYFNEVVRDGGMPQRVAMRARVLLALDRGERVIEIVHWLGVGRMTISDLWPRYQQRGIDAISDAERSGRPPTFTPPGARPHRTRCLH